VACQKTNQKWREVAAVQIVPRARLLTEHIVGLMDALTTRMKSKTVQTYKTRLRELTRRAKAEGFLTQRALCGVPP